MTRDNCSFTFVRLDTGRDISADDADHAALAEQPGALRLRSHREDVDFGGDERPELLSLLLT